MSHFSCSISSSSIQNNIHTLIIMKRHARYLNLIIFGLASLGVTGQAYAAMHPHSLTEQNQEQVMLAVQRGLIQPYSELQKKVDDHLVGRIIRVQLDNLHNQWVYKLRLIDNDNNIIKVDYNAKTLDVINMNPPKHIRVVDKVTR